MHISKTELSIGIEILYAILFTLIFMPFFFNGRETDFTWEALLGPGIKVLVFTIVYFSVTYGFLKVMRKDEIEEDEREAFIQAKSYKTGYILYELALLFGLGQLIVSTPQANGAILFITLTLLLAVSVLKSTYQLYLHQTV
jgi:uncharacterized membrane protein